MGARRFDVSRRIREQVWRRRIVWMLVVLIGLWILLAPGQGLLHYWNLDRCAGLLVEENQALEQENLALREELERLRGDDEYLEEIARREHGLLKKNEVVYDFGPGAPDKDGK